MVVMKYNYKYILDMIRFASQFGIELVVFVAMGYWGQDLEWYNEQKPFGLGRDYRELYQEAHALAKSLGPSLREDPEATIAAADPALDSDFQFCAVPFEAIYIHNDGKVSPCCAMQPYVLGSISKYERKTGNLLWNDVHMKVLRSQMVNRTYNELCLLCDLHYGINKGRLMA